LAKQRLRVGVLFGGRSAEHEVSLQSARSVLEAMDRDKYEIIPIGVTKAGEWLTVDTPALGAPTRVLDEDGDRVSLLPEPERQSLVPLAERSVNGISPKTGGTPLDVIFPLIHGPLGEDGTVQGLFELADIAYVGSGVLGSAAGMDKVAMKALFENRCLPITPYRAVLRKQWQADPRGIQSACEAAFPYPWFVKPANMGSSVGVSKVHDASELMDAMSSAAEYDRKLLVEAAVEDAREIEVAVLGNDEPEASVPGEIVPSNEFYDYGAKYLDGATRLIIPADLPETMTRRMKELALEAFRALDCAGLARVDFLVSRSDLEVYVSEVNTLPGFTSVSMYPKLWEASGVPYPELIDRLIDLALERQEERRGNRRSFTE
jgi:D-alanine-D-alanine ligase